MPHTTKLRPETAIASHEEIVLARQQVRGVAEGMGFSVLDQTRIVTAVSELARNMVVHAQGGRMQIFEVNGTRHGLRLVFADNGPGIADVARALGEGYSTAGSLGLGLPGAQKLCDLMEIDTAPGEGTTVSITKWLPQDI